MKRFLRPRICKFHWYWPCLGSLLWHCMHCLQSTSKEVGKLLIFLFVANVLGFHISKAMSQCPPPCPYATHWRPFGSQPRVYQNFHREKFGAKPIINPWERNN